MGARKADSRRGASSSKKAVGRLTAGSLELRFDTKLNYQYWTGFQLYSFVDSGLVWWDGLRPADGTALTFQLRDDVRWHDDKPFTADDVKCTFDLLTNQGKEKLRLNYRESWWVNVSGAVVDGNQFYVRLKEWLKHSS